MVYHIHIARSVHREPRMVHFHLRIEHSPVGYRWLLLSRPERRNAIDLDLAQARAMHSGRRRPPRWCSPAPTPGLSARAPT